MRLSAVERKIVNRIQTDLPLSKAPFSLISKGLGLDEDELIRKIKGLKARGVIRGISAGVDHSRLGFISSLIAIRLPAGEIESAAKKIISYKEVTHCFLRDGEYNLWVVFISPRKSDLDKFLKTLAKLAGSENVLSLPTIRKFKLKTTIEV